MDRLKSWLHVKTRPKHSLKTRLLDEVDSDVLYEKIREIEEKIKLLENKLYCLKNESISNKKRIRNLKLLLEEKEEIIKELKKR